MDARLAELERLHHASPSDAALGHQLGRTYLRSGRRTDAYLAFWRAGIDPPRDLRDQLVGEQRDPLRRLARETQSSEVAWRGRPGAWEWQSADDPAAAPVLAVRPGRRFKNALFDRLTALSTLVEVDLSAFGRVSAAGIKTLGTASGLERLSLVGSKLPGSSLRWLTRFHSLRALDLSECERLADRDLVHVAAVRSLSELHLTGCTGLTGAGLQSLRDLPLLRVLTLGRLRCSGESLVFLSATPQLRRLDLSGWDLANDDLLALSGLAELRDLCLWGCPALSGATFDAFADLQRLEHLDLSFCEALRDEHLGALSACRELVSLTLSGCPLISERGLRALEGLPKLQHLDVSGCPQVPEEVQRWLLERA